MNNRVFPRSRSKSNAQPGRLGKLTLGLFAVLAAASLSLSPAPALAADGAGNELTSAGNMNAQTVEGNLYWAGESLDLTDTTVTRDVIAAGQTIALTDTTVGGSVRTASQNLNLTGTKVAGDVTSAAQYITLGEGTEAQAIYSAAGDVRIIGTAKCGAVFGQTVTIDGTVDGDINVTAQKLVIGKNAHITGTVHATLGADPQVKDGSEVGKLDVTYSEQLAEKESNSVEDLAWGLLAAVVSAIGTCLAALLLSALFPRAMVSAAGMARTKKTQTIASGVIAVIFFVPAVLLLCITIAGLGLAGALVATVVAIWFAAVPFCAAALGRVVLPKMNRIASAAICGLVLGFASNLPYIGIVFTIAAVVLVHGYLVQLTWEGIKSGAKANNGNNDAPQGLPMAQ